MKCGFLQARVLKAVTKDELDKHKAAKKGPYHKYDEPYAGYRKCIDCGHLTSVAVYMFAVDAFKAGEPNATQWTQSQGYR